MLLSLALFPRFDSAFASLSALLYCFNDILFLTNGLSEALKPKVTRLNQSCVRDIEATRRGEEEEEGADHISSPTTATISNAREKTGCVSARDKR